MIALPSRVRVFHKHAATSAIREFVALVAVAKKLGLK
jgi:hypothetical protein